VSHGGRVASRQPRGKVARCYGRAVAVVPPVVLTIAGSDPSGGAGLQADLRTIAAHRLYGAAVPTALTVQNTLGVLSSTVLMPDLVAAQLAAVLDDLPVAAVKIGMLGTQGNVVAVLDALRSFSIPIVLDPVVRSSSGAELLDGGGVQVLRDRSAELALITPNLAEAEALLGERVGDPAAAAVALRDALGCPVLLTGGHGSDPDRCVDHLAAHAEWALSAPRVVTSNDHGTGCLLSTSITCALATGAALLPAVEHGRECVALALRGSLAVGAGAGPVFLLRAPPL
jgi:hydroxymethylpyrimidine/phosphomethylpyrimidine kinase